jgi:hypothetical protein
MSRSTPQPPDSHETPTGGAPPPPGGDSLGLLPPSPRGPPLPPETDDSGRSMESLRSAVWAQAALRPDELASLPPPRKLSEQRAATKRPPLAWPPLDTEPPGSCPGVGKPLVQREPAPMWPSCSACEWCGEPGTEVAPEHPAAASVLDRRANRLEAWVEAAQVELARLRVEVLGAQADNSELGERVATQGQYSKRMQEELYAIKDRVRILETPSDAPESPRRVADLEEQVSDRQPMTGTRAAHALQMESEHRHRAAVQDLLGDIRLTAGAGHLAKALRHLAAWLEDEQAPAPPGTATDVCPGSGSFPHHGEPCLACQQWEGGRWNPDTRRWEIPAHPRARDPESRPPQGGTTGTSTGIKIEGECSACGTRWAVNDMSSDRVLRLEHSSCRAPAQGPTT